MRFSVSKILNFFRKVFRRKTVLKVEKLSVEIEVLDETNTKVLDEIIAGTNRITGTMEIVDIDEFLFAPFPILNCIHRDHCSKNLFKCNWIKEEMMMSNERVE